jgi:hypothetical protein
MVRSSADEMEVAKTFAVRIVVDLDTPDGFGEDVVTTIDGVVDLEAGTSRSAASSSDGDAWSDIVIDDTAYHSRGPAGEDDEWCAIPIDKVSGPPLLQIGVSFSQVPDALRSATSAIPTSEVAADPSAMGYQISLPSEEAGFGVRVVDDEARLWLDADGRPTQVSYTLSLPISGAPTPATAQVRWTLTGWGETEVSVEIPSPDQTHVFPDCVL